MFFTLALNGIKYLCKNSPIWSQCHNPKIHRCWDSNLDWRSKGQARWLFGPPPPTTTTTPARYSPADAISIQKCHFKHICKQDEYPWRLKWFSLFRKDSNNGQKSFRENETILQFCPKVKQCETPLIYYRNFRFLNYFLKLIPACY